jgi:hypothetical protein
VVEFLIASLAVWRVSRFIRKENGPACFMSRIRNSVCDRYCKTGRKTDDKADGKTGRKTDGTLAEWFECNKCCGFGVAVIGTLIWASVVPDRWSLPIWLAMPWGLSAATFAYEYADEMFAIEAKLGWEREREFDGKGE